MASRAAGAGLTRRATASRLVAQGERAGRAEGLLLELAVAVTLIAINGLFALSELAVVSARRPRLKAMADDGRRGAAQALRLAEDPGRFLSTVQIGITLVGILAGVFSGAGLSARLQEIFQGWGLSARLAEPAEFLPELEIAAAEHVRAEAQLRNQQAGTAEFAIAHARSPLDS